MNQYYLKIFFGADEILEIKTDIEEYLNSLHSSANQPLPVMISKGSPKIGALSSIDHTIADYVITVTTSVAASALFKGFFSYAIEKLKSRTSESQSKSITVRINDKVIEVKGNINADDVENYIQLIVKNNTEDK